VIAGFGGVVFSMGRSWHRTVSSHEWPAGLAKEETVADAQLTLTEEESDYLVQLLETQLKETRVEEHRTRTPSYRETVLRNEQLLASVLNKLRRS
jgi:hypothetical protein